MEPEYSLHQQMCPEMKYLEEVCNYYFSVIPEALKTLLMLNGH